MIEKKYSEFEDSAEILCKFDNCIGIAETNWISPKKVRTLRVTGTKGMVELDYMTQNLILTEKSESYGLKKIDFVIEDMVLGEERRIIVNMAEPLKEELKHFLDCIEDKVEPRITPKEAADALKVVDAACESYKTHREVNVKRS